MSLTDTFEIIETTIADIHDAYIAGRLTAQELVQMYLDRIEKYDKNGPKINVIIEKNKLKNNGININPNGIRILKLSSNVRE